MHEADFMDQSFEDLFVQPHNNLHLIIIFFLSLEGKGVVVLSLLVLESHLVSEHSLSLIV